MDEERIKIYLEFLACPKCKGDLVYHKAEKMEGFLCPKCLLLYPIVEDIPEMLIEAAIPLKNEPSSKG